MLRPNFQDISWAMTYLYKNQSAECSAVWLNCWDGKWLSDYNGGPCGGAKWWILSLIALYPSAIKLEVLTPNYNDAPMLNYKSKSCQNQNFQEYSQSQLDFLNTEMLKAYTQFWHADMPCICQEDKIMQTGWDWEDHWAYPFGLQEYLLSLHNLLAACRIHCKTFISQLLWQIWQRQAATEKGYKWPINTASKQNYVIWFKITMSEVSKVLLISLKA